jgi:uncharacterized membrane protein required for colicin V production
MGLDLALGMIILLAAFRGWLQGFISQAVKIGSLVACVYLADYVRAYAKPHLLPYLASVPADVVDPLLWWVAAAITCVLLVGLATLIIKMTRRPEIPGIPQSTRNDQFAGFLLGATKGFLVAAFVTAGIQKYAMDQVKTVAWVHDQVNASMAIKWNDEYRPAARIWQSKPVRRFVAQVRRMGRQEPGSQNQPPVDGDRGDVPQVRTASRHPGLEIAGQDGDHASSAGVPAPPEPGLLDPETERAIQDIKAELSRGARRPN